jgi:2-succinyl-5-enolpyruvyl-6-hydroxy-3-cyclohexene-1-carboxylate synthase
MLPDVAYIIGDRLISDTVHKFLNNPEIHLVRVSNSSFRDDGIENEFLYPKDRITYDSFFEILEDLECADSVFKDYYKNLESLSRTKTESVLENEKSTERSAILKVIKASPQNTNIFLSNSLIFREAENFVSNLPDNVKLYANRGATGIDGIISSSVGTMISNDRKLICILGDQAALHDLTGLSSIKLTSRPTMLLVINNGGGSIFNLMKKKELRDTLINPHELNFKSFSEGFNLQYFLVSDSDELVKIQKQIFENDLQAVVEFKTDGIESVKKLYNL